MDETVTIANVVSQAATAFIASIHDNPVALLLFMCWIGTLFVWRNDVSHYRQKLKESTDSVVALTLSIDALAKGLEFIKGNIGALRG